MDESIQTEKNRLKEEIRRNPNHIHSAIELDKQVEREYITNYKAVGNALFLIYKPHISITHVEEDQSGSTVTLQCTSPEAMKKLYNIIKCQSQHISSMRPNHHGMTMKLVLTNNYSYVYMALIQNQLLPWMETYKNIIEQEIWQGKQQQ